MHLTVTLSKLTGWHKDEILALTVEEAAAWLDAAIEVTNHFTEKGL